MVDMMRSSSANLVWAMCLSATSSLAITQANTTANLPSLQTWWHHNGEKNIDTPVQVSNVRQSHLYSASVQSTVESPNTYFDSFVYETIPRNGQGNIVVPGDLSSTTDEDDAVTIEETIWITMSWTEFLYGQDSVVKISRAGNSSTTAGDVVIRPSSLDLAITDDGAGNIYIEVPYLEEGLRFSVEFKDNVYAYHNSCDTTECDFVQDWHPDGPDYVEGYGEENIIMGVEPHDALLIFASPFPTEDVVADETSDETYVVYPGEVPDLSSIQNSVVFFQPGVHYMAPTTHALLSKTVDWVYLAPGSYIKGAFEFTTEAVDIKATGFGVVSGERYVYQANTAKNYTNTKSNGDSLRIWSGQSIEGKQQTFTLTGVTTNSPPFNSIDFEGDYDSIAIHQWDYKQVGAYFGQTDGTTLYANSQVRDSFLHSGDDTIKTYGSNVDVRNMVIWKTKTAPIVQFGWAARDLSNITVDGVDVIHSHWSSNMSHPSIIGANQIYEYSEDQQNTADLSMTVKDLYFGNIVAEGFSGNLLRICPLANYENVTIENVAIEKVSARSNGIYRSEMPVFTDSDGNAVSVTGFVVRNFTLGGERITQEADNFGPDALGGLNFATEFLEGGNITIV